MLLLRFVGRTPLSDIFCKILKHVEFRSSLSEVIVCSIDAHECSHRVVSAGIRTILSSLSLSSFCYIATALDYEVATDPLLNISTILNR